MDNSMPAREMHDAVCAECGNATQVPFKPSGDRPVYCRDCFSKRRGNDRGGFSSRGPREMHDAVCATCGAPTQVPFKPTEGRPVYCREHFKRD